MGHQSEFLSVPVETSTNEANTLVNTEESVQDTSLSQKIKNKKKGKEKIMLFCGCSS